MKDHKLIHNPPEVSAAATRLKSAVNAHEVYLTELTYRAVIKEIVAMTSGDRFDGKSSTNVKVLFNRVAGTYTRWSKICEKVSLAVAPFTISAHPTSTPNSFKIMIEFQNDSPI